MAEEKLVELGQVKFTEPRGVAAEGARIGLMTCLRCGAALLIDPDDTFDPAFVHRRWHEVSDPTWEDVADE